MAKTRGAEIFSIFGQIESVVAEEMVKEGKMTKIPSERIPATAAYDESNRRAYFAVVVPRENVLEFNDRIRTLYA